MCREPALFHCFPSHSNCYNTSDICMYRLKRNGILIPCRTGSHLQNCEEFKCNAGYKCTGHYCIPWGYVCDGKWDCPFGSEEDTFVCQAKDRCQGMFVCAKSQICIHQNDVCDFHADCPEGEDEVLCELQSDPCLENCVCFHLAIMCRNVAVDISMLPNLPYFSYHLTFVSIVDLTFAAQNHVVQVLNVSQNNVREICLDFKSVKLMVLDCSSNLVRKVTRHCFSGLLFLKTVVLKNNSISSLAALSFGHLEKLKVLDLSFNEIQTIQKETFVNISLQTLILVENPIKSGDYNLFSSFQICLVETESFTICCVAPEQTACTTPKPWFVLSCSALLPNIWFRVFFVVFSAFGGTAACAALFATQMNPKRHQTNRNSSLGPYNSIVSAVSLCNTSFPSYTFLICAIDLYFGTEFIVIHTLWKKNILCAISFFLHLVFSLMQPLLFVYLSLSRLMVVLYPLHSQLKSRGFVTIQLLGILVLVTLISIISTFTLSNFSGISNALCIPFVDPLHHSFVPLFLIILLIVIHLSEVSACSVMSVGLAQTLGNKTKISMKRKLSLKSKIQMILQILNSMLCWMPLSLTYLILWTSSKYSMESLVWAVMVLMNVNVISTSLLFMIFRKNESEK